MPRPQARRRGAKGVVPEGRRRGRRGAPQGAEGNLPGGVPLSTATGAARSDRSVDARRVAVRRAARLGCAGDVLAPGPPHARRAQAHALDDDPQDRQSHDLRDRRHRRDRGRRQPRRVRARERRQPGPGGQRRVAVAGSSRRGGGAASPRDRRAPSRDRSTARTAGRSSRERDQGPSNPLSRRGGRFVRRQPGRRAGLPRRRLRIRRGARRPALQGYAKRVRRRGRGVPSDVRSRDDRDRRGRGRSAGRRLEGLHGTYPRIDEAPAGAPETAGRGPPSVYGERAANAFCQPDPAISAVICRSPKYSRGAEAEGSPKPPR